MRKGDRYKDYKLMGCDIMQFGTQVVRLYRTLLPTLSRWKVKGKVALDHAKTAQRAIRGTDPLIFKINTGRK